MAYEHTASRPSLILSSLPAVRSLALCPAPAYHTICQRADFTSRGRHPGLVERAAINLQSEIGQGAGEGDIN